MLQRGGEGLMILMVRRLLLLRKDAQQRMRCLTVCLSVHNRYLRLDVVRRERQTKRNLGRDETHGAKHLVATSRDSREDPHKTSS